LLALTFSVTGAQPEKHSAAPLLNFRLRIQEATGTPVHAILLRAQIRIQPRRRAYTATEQQRLADLFGAPEQWAESVRPLLWTHASSLVPAFSREVEVDLSIPCTYDLEVGSSKYFDALDDGEVQLLFLFSGTAFVKAENGFQVEQIPWEKEASYRLPVRAWRELMDSHFPGGGWIRLSRTTIDSLRRIKAREALCTWDEVMESLLNAEKEAVG
jgi:hypothetical protein